MEVVIPTVEERIVQRALRRILEPILEQNAFGDFVSGFRPGRSRLTSVRQAWRYLEQGRTFVVDVDVNDMWAGGNTDQLLDLLHQWVADGMFLALVRRVLTALPQPTFPGSGLTPMLLNLRLTPLDKAVAHMPVVRFTDNYTLFYRTEAEATLALAMIVNAADASGFSFGHKQTVHFNPNPEDLYLFGGQ